MYYVYFNYTSKEIVTIQFISTLVSISETCLLLISSYVERKLLSVHLFVYLWLLTNGQKCCDFRKSKYQHIKSVQLFTIQTGFTIYSNISKQFYLHVTVNKPQYFDTQPSRQPLPILFVRKHLRSRLVNRNFSQKPRHFVRPYESRVIILWLSTCPCR